MEMEIAVAQQVAVVGVFLKSKEGAQAYVWCGWPIMGAMLSKEEGNPLSMQMYAAV